MSKLSDFLVAGVSIPSQIESKVTVLPKVSTMLSQAATAIPAGPDIPVNVMAAPILPALPTLPAAPTGLGFPTAGRVIPVGGPGMGGIGARGTLSMGGYGIGARGTL